MSKRFVGLILILLTLHATVETAFAQNTPGHSITVECHGKLRCGGVAIAGETKGINISFNKVNWELNLQDENSKKFAKEHDSSKVTIKGKLRHLEGVERKNRWIVDVTEIRETDSKITESFTTATVHGKLEKRNDKLVIASNGITWPVEFAEGSDLKAKADSLIAKTVIVKGKVEKVEGVSLPVNVKMKAETIEPVPVTASSKR